jgi:hypothetical protein
MSKELEEKIKGYENEYLLEQFYQKKGEYNETALSIMEQEIIRRKIPDDIQSPYKTGTQGPGKTAERRKYQPEEFEAFSDLFSPTDIMLVNVMFDESKIPFYVDNPPSSAFPTEGMADTFLKIHVHKDHITEAHQLLDEHFVKEDGRYKVKFDNDKQQLKALNYHEVTLGGQVSEEDVGVVLAKDEAAAVITYGRRLVNEVDTIEKEQERIVLYLDNIEDLIGRLESDPALPLSKTDFFTVTEILQIYCDDPAFPECLNSTVKAILDFFEAQK